MVLKRRVNLSPQGDELKGVEERLGLAQKQIQKDSLKEAPPLQSRPKYSIVLPAYNEEARIAPTIKGLMAEFGSEAEILVVDDGSRDRTAEIASKLGARVVSHLVNRGKGAAVRTGFLNSVGETVGFVDSDNSAKPSDVRRVFSKAHETGAAVGSRLIKSEGLEVKRTPVRSLASWTFRQASRLLSGVDVKDTQCGCKAFSSELAKRIADRLEIKGWAFDIELLRIVKSEGYKAAPVEISWHDQKGSKINLMTDSFKMLWDIIKLRLRN